jgi:hypothetical protein
MLRVVAPAYTRTTLLPTFVPDPIVPGPVIVAVTDSEAAWLDALSNVSVIVARAAFVDDTVATAEETLGSVNVDVAADEVFDSAAVAETTMLRSFETAVPATPAL